LSRNFTKLKKAGVIGLPSSSQVEVHDLDRLEEFADGDER